MRPPAVEEGILFAWWVYSTLKFWGLLGVEYGLDLSTKQLRGVREGRRCSLTVQFIWFPFVFVSLVSGHDRERPM